MGAPLAVGGQCGEGATRPVMAGAKCSPGGEKQEGRLRRRPSSEVSLCVGYFLFRATGSGAFVVKVRSSSLRSTTTMSPSLNSPAKILADSGFST